MSGMKLKRIISGGQNGVDQAGLAVGKALGFQVGGSICKGFKTLDGPKPELGTRYGLVEIESTNYKDRTWKNVESSDATLVIARNLNSNGERCTRNAIENFEKPALVVNLNKPLNVQLVARWIQHNEVETLNIAGNSEKTVPGIGKEAEAYLTKVLKEYIKLHQPLENGNA